ncbi:MAG: hypothetical protein ACJAQT_001328 [Akkermansiaceae bacterium]|jgi:hypothetical protein
MKILVVHYHLRAGGVTRVIESQVNVLQKMGHQVIIASAGPGHDQDCQCLLIPELDYQKEGSIPMEQLLAVEADLWIIHNPCLGLNVAYPEMIEAAAESGTRILMQCHDFVEDGRPANYQLLAGRKRIYPHAPHVHYATINRRDLDILKKAGVPESRSHFLPNAVDPPAISQAPPRGNLVFYPVRGIRRKNLGELCLLAAHAPPNTRFAVALRSTSEEPAFIHDDWVCFAEEANLPIQFDVVGDDPQSFKAWLERSSHLVTTSISEGFGLTFLDPAFLKKPLIGRDLPEITRDFVPYGTLYRSIPVPLSHLVGLESQYREQITLTMSAYGRDLDEPQLDRAWSQFNSQDEVDFGNLPEALQRDVIQKVHLPDLKIWLENALNQPATEIDTTPWSLETYAATLQRVITSVDGPGSITWIPPKRLLEQFLKPEKFHFLRSKLPEAR